MVRELFLEYAAWLGVDLCFQGFEEELAGLPGKYAPPQGRLFILGQVGMIPPPYPLPQGEGESSANSNVVMGCGAFRGLDDETCEMKRLFIREEFRGGGLGRKMAEHLVEEARDAGYKFMVLDTLRKMSTAVSLYRSMGFEECEAYYENPVPGVVYLRLAL